MHTKLHPDLRHFLSVAAAGFLAVALSSCTGRGGGQLPPQTVYKGPASFGFSFSCEDKGGTNPQPGQLRIQLSYTDHGTNPLGSSFSIHGTADVISAELESMICIGQEAPPGGNELIFLGRYRPTSSAPQEFPTVCATAVLGITPACRFEVIVRDNDSNRVPSIGDYFQIRLSNVTAVVSEFKDPNTVFYSRSGTLSSGNITVE